MCKKLLSLMLAIVLFVGTVSVSVPVYATGADSKVEIVTQPESTVVSKGETAKATVEASGEGLTYQWYYKDTNMKSFGRSSVKTDTYTVEMKASKDGRQVYCKITDKYGNSVKTETVTLQMAKALAITEQPESASAPNGESVTVTFTASGEGLTYTWYYKNKGAGSFKKTDTFTGNTYTAEMNATRDGRQVYCKVTDKYGDSVNTETVTLQMDKAITITKQPESASAPNGKTATVTFTASGEGLTYTWYYKNKGASSFKKTDTFAGNTYTAEMNSTRDGRQVYCKVTDMYGNSEKTETVTLRMEKALTITKQPKSATAARGETATVTFTASGDGLKYTWYYKNKGASSFKKTSTFTGDTYTAEMNATRDGRQVYCKVTDMYGKSVKTETVTLRMVNPLKITKQPESVAAYKGERAKVTFTASGDGLKYTWYYKNSDSSSFKKTSTFTSNAYSAEMSASRDGRQIYCKVTDKYGNSVQTDTVVLYLKRTPASNGCADCADKSGGMTFDTNAVYTQTEKPAVMPLTYEAVFQISEDDLDSAMRKLDSKEAYKETAIFSNDDTYDVSICVSVTEDGHPKLGLRQKDWYCRFNNLLFDEVNVFSDEPVHLAITLDHSARKAKCYVDGELLQTVTIPKAAKDPFVPTYAYAVGGDLYSGNPNYFRGELYSLGIWSDMRSAEEITADYYAGVSTSDKNLMAYYDLSLCESCMRQDQSVSGNDLKHEKLWLTEDEVAPVGEYDYSFAVIGDTQELSEDDPATFTALYEWIVDNKEAHKIEYVLGLGDITQKSYAHEWDHAKEQIYKLNDVVPYLLTRGNHDYDTVEDGVVTAGFNKTFDDGIYNQQLTDVMVEGDVSNAYRTLKIGDVDYLFMTLDFGPNDEVLAWANSVVEAHPDHRVVMVTHGYMYRDGTTLDKYDAYSASRYPLRDKKAEQAEKPSRDGDEIWEKFASQHENVQLVISGHDPCQHVVYRQDAGKNGNIVTQMLVDAQHIDGFLSPTSMVAMFYFSDNGNTLTVRYYSVVKDMYGSESSQFTIDLS